MFCGRIIWETLLLILNILISSFIPIHWFTDTLMRGGLFFNPPPVCAIRTGNFLLCFSFSCSDPKVFLFSQSHIFFIASKCFTAVSYITEFCKFLIGQSYRNHSFALLWPFSLLWLFSFSICSLIVNRKHKQLWLIGLASNPWVSGSAPKIGR